jgi:hypothetical protein
MELDNVSLAYEQEDQRPAFTLDDASDTDFHHVKAQKPPGRVSLHMTNVRNFTVRESSMLPDQHLDSATQFEK